MEPETRAVKPPSPTEPLACSLSPGELVDRRGEWEALRAHALRVQADEGVVRAVYARREEVLRRLESLIEAEGRCCPFLGFELREEPDSIALEVTFPPDLGRPPVALGLA